MLRAGARKPSFSGHKFDAHFDRAAARSKADLPSSGAKARSANENRKALEKQGS
jgi:hypothetical protein